MISIMATIAIPAPVNAPAGALRCWTAERYLALIVVSAYKTSLDMRGPRAARLRLMIDDAQLNRQRVAKTRQRKRDAGLVPKERWAHPDDWTKIDALIARLNKKREN